jgi:uncharacterized membrane protein YfcA
MQYEVSIVLPWCIGMLCGLMVSVLGMGGSLIMAPILLYIFGIAASDSQGTINFQMLFISLISCVMHNITSASVDIVLSIALVLGVTLGSHIGYKIGARLSQETFKIIIATIVLIMCIKVGHDLFATPRNIYQVEMLK